MLPIGDENPGKRGLPAVMLALVLINALVYLYETTLTYAELGKFVQSWGMTPAEIERGEDLYTLLTSMFVHGSFAHIFSNMLFLWIFADNIERRFGAPLFLLFYLGTGVAAGIAHLLSNPGSTIPTVGASGAVSGVLGAYLLLYPRNRVRLLVGFFGYVYVRAYLFLGIWFILQLVSGISTLGMRDMPMSGVAFWAHIGGFVAGLIATLLIRPFRPEPAPSVDLRLWQDSPDRQPPPSPWSDDDPN